MSANQFVEPADTASDFIEPADTFVEPANTPVAAAGEAQPASGLNTEPAASASSPDAPVDTRPGGSLGLGGLHSALSAVNAGSPAAHPRVGQDVDRE